MEGWISLHRCLLEKPIWKNSTPEQKSIFITLLLMAWHQGNDWEWKKLKFKTEKGQFVTSLDSIASEAGKGVSVQNVRSAIKRFVKLGFLTNESTKTGRLITIVNWDSYQKREKKATKPSTIGQQRGNKQVTPNNNVNNKNIVERIVNYLNEKTNSHYRSSSKKTQTLICARLKEGFETKDFRAVIDLKTDEWFRNPEMQQYLRPETLFGTKFESYLNQKPKEPEIQIIDCGPNL